MDLDIDDLIHLSVNNHFSHAVGYLNINSLSDFCDLFTLFNLVNVKTCTKSVCGTSFDIMLTNKPGN